MSYREVIVNNKEAKLRIEMKKAEHDAKDICSNPYCTFCNKKTSSPSRKSY